MVGVAPKKEMHRFDGDDGAIHHHFGVTSGPISDHAHRKRHERIGGHGQISVDGR